MRAGFDRGDHVTADCVDDPASHHRHPEFFCVEEFASHLGDDLVLAAGGPAQALNFVFEGTLAPVALALEEGWKVVNGLLLPAVENGRLETVFLTDIGDRFPNDEVASDDGRLLFGGEVFALLCHSEVLKTITNGNLIQCM